MIYKHYKDGLYRALFHATESTNARVNPRCRLGVVVYVSLTTGEVHVRDSEEFFGDVETPDGIRARFAEVRPEKK